MNIVFDIGNVLVRWDPVAAFADAFQTRAAAETFLTRTGFSGLNLRGDGGALFADLATEVADPEDAALIAAYPARFHRSVQAKIPGTWDLMAALRAKGHRIHAITNWSAETWPVGVAVHPELASSFEVTVVSGEERVLKPEARIFEILCERANVLPKDCLFIDDSEKNVAGALTFGMDAVLFTGPDQLRSDLSERGLL